MSFFYKNIFIFISAIISFSAYAKAENLPPMPPVSSQVSQEQIKVEKKPANTIYPDNYNKNPQPKDTIEKKVPTAESSRIDFYKGSDGTKPISPEERQKRLEERMKAYGFKNIKKEAVTQSNNQTVITSPSISQNTVASPNITPSTVTSNGLPNASTTTTPIVNVSKSPTVVSSKSNNEWIYGSVSNLDKIGALKVPSWVDYNSLISQKDFSIMLSKVTKISDKNFFGDLDSNGFEKSMSRGLAFDSAIKAFGLEREVEKIETSYKTKFKDLNQNHKYYKACLTAEVIKLSAGYPDKTFRPDDLLKWSEAVAIVESVHRWASLLPEQTPIQKAVDFKKNIWYYFLDGFRLLLTLVYSVLSFIFLIRAWKRSKNDKTGLREIISSLCFATASLFIMWINEMLYARGLIDKPIYYIISTISVLAGLFLIRTSTLISKQTQPKPETNVEVAHVEYIDISRGEMFVVDSITKRRILTLISPETKLYSKENRLLGKAFLSEIGVGDFVSIKGTEQLNGGAVVKADMLLILASKQNTTVTKNTSVEVSEKQEFKINNVIRETKKN